MDDMDDVKEEVIEEVIPGKKGSKFSDAFSKILEKSKAKAGLDKLETKTAKQAVKQKVADVEAQAATRQARTERLALRKRGKRAPSRKGEDSEQDALQRRLLVTATRGVVRLFNAVRKEQRVIEESEAPVKGTNKRTFLEELKGAATAAKITDVKAQGSIHHTQPVANASTWEVFDDDIFTSKNRLRDWDKETPADELAGGGASDGEEGGQDSDY